MDLYAMRISWLTTETQRIQTQNHHDSGVILFIGWLWYFEHVSTVRNDWCMPGYATIGNTVHITEISAAQAATADHDAEKVHFWKTWKHMEHYLGYIHTVLTIVWRYCILWFLYWTMKHVKVMLIYHGVTLIMFT